MTTIEEAAGLLRRGLALAKTMESETDPVVRHGGKLRALGCLEYTAAEALRMLEQAMACTRCGGSGRVTFRDDEHEASGPCGLCGGAGGRSA